MENQGSRKEAVKQLFQDCMNNNSETNHSSSSQDFALQDGNASQRRLVDYSCSSEEEIEDAAEIHDLQQHAVLFGSALDRKPKKVIPKPSNWMVSQRKAKRNSGKEYTSRSKKTIPARSMKLPTCTAKNCRTRCTTKITEAERQLIFTKFWSIGDIEKQRYFLLSCMENINPGARLGRAMIHVFSFAIPSTPGRIKVCKSFFKATLGVTDRMIRTTIRKAGPSGELQPDLRGKVRVNPRKLAPARKQEVIEFIAGIPRVESHYLRQQTGREYIDGSKSMMDLYRDLKKKYYPENDLGCLTYSQFRYIFNTEFNISFFLPKKDQCEDCAAFLNKTPAEQTSDDRHWQHLKEKELARAEKERDKKATSDELVVAAYDLQAVLPVPRGDISVLYYLSRVATYNFTICELNNMKAYCYLWHEGEASRGSNELASCLLKFLQKVSQERTTEFDVVFYSDNCPGQNKNKNIIGFYHYALQTIQKLRSITHKFLIKGHTQNEGDAIHSVIEKQVKRFLKSGPIFVPAQYAQIIKDSKKTAPYFDVNELCHDNFYDFQKLTAQLGKNFTTNIEGTSINFGDIKIIRLTKENPESFQYKTSYQDDSYGIICFKKAERQARKRQFPSQMYDLPPDYNKKPKVAENKINELLKLIKKNVIPQSFQPFYESL